MNPISGSSSSSAFYHLRGASSVCFQNVLVTIKQTAFEEYSQLKLRGQAPKALRWKRLEQRYKAHKQCVTDLLQFLRNHNVRFTCVNRVELDRQHLNNVDLMIAVGGDGTVLSAAHFLDHGTIPILGINSDPNISIDDMMVMRKRNDERRSHGALCMCTSQDMYSELQPVLYGGGYIQQRTRIRCKVKSTFSETRLVPALNDLLIANPSPAAVSRFRMGWLEKQQQQQNQQDDDDDDDQSNIERQQQFYDNNIDCDEEGLKQIRSSISSSSQQQQHHHHHHTTVAQFRTMDSMAEPAPPVVDTSSSTSAAAAPPPPPPPGSIGTAAATPTGTVPNPGPAGGPIIPLPSEPYLTRFNYTTYNVVDSINVWSSGMWVCTATGSTAAMAAAGGQAMDIVCNNNNNNVKSNNQLQYLIREHMMEKVPNSPLRRSGGGGSCNADDADDVADDTSSNDDNAFDDDTTKNNDMIQDGEKLHIRWNSQRGRIFIDGSHLTHNLELGDEILIDNMAPPLNMYSRYTTTKTKTNSSTNTNE